MSVEQKRDSSVCNRAGCRWYRFAVGEDENGQRLARHVCRLDPNARAKAIGFERDLPPGCPYLTEQVVSRC